MKAAAVLIIFLVVPLAVGYMEHKVLAHMQARMGPMEAGKFHGWAQLMADGAKFIQKEGVVPAAADRTVFSIAPGVAHVPYLVVLFDIPVADSEIIFGAYTEYTGLKFAFFLLSEYGGIVVMSAVASVLFLGGFLPLPGLSFIPGPIWMFGKIFALSFVIVWLRATFPRLREDQLQRFAWVGLTPLALALILVTSVYKVGV